MQAEMHARCRPSKDSRSGVASVLEGLREVHESVRNSGQLVDPQKVNDVVLPPTRLGGTAAGWGAAASTEQERGLYSTTFRDLLRSVLARTYHWSLQRPEPRRTPARPQATLAGPAICAEPRGRDRPYTTPEVRESTGACYSAARAAHCGVVQRHGAATPCVARRGPGPGGSPRLPEHPLGDAVGSATQAGVDPWVGSWPV